MKLSRDQANAANEAKNQFLANISHEIRTPMNAVIGFSDILGDEQLTHEQKDYVNIIHNCGKHLMQIIDDILDFSKIETGNLDVEMIDCSLAELLNRVESILQHQVSEKGLEFQIRKDDRLPAIIHTDSNRIRQCLTNLVNNAIKFTETGHIYVNVSLEDKDNQPFIRFVIEDTGIGISAEKKDRIFESFTQADGSTSRKYGGTGLGLPITRHLAKLLGGKLSLTSEEGKGSIFSLVIPAGIDVKKQSLEDRGNIEAHIDTTEDKIQQLKLSGHVLVAEDVETNQMLVKSLLNKMNLEVTIAADGKETVQKALAEKFDLILMDIQMPHMNGYEATEKLREEGIKTPIVALTANALKGDREKCISAGCDDYLPKPIDRQQLMEKILKYLPQENQNLNGTAEHSSPATEQAAEQTQLNESIVPNEGIIDWDQLINRLGDEELIKEVVSIFLEDNKERFDKLCEAVKSKNSSEIKFYAHAIKGIAINIGAKQLSDIACRLECADMQNNTREATLLFDKLKTELEKVVAFLSRTDWIEIVKSGKTITNERLKANI